jgi:hypothetical protein
MASVVKHCYSYGFLIVFMLAIFGIVIFCCYGKSSTPQPFAWDDLTFALSHMPQRKQIHKKHETRCRAILERLLKAPFTSVRPAFLKYTTGKNLELDGYNAELKIAFEYQGIQHRQFTPLFHKTYTDFQKQVERDTWKANVCAKKGILLLSIPDTVPYESLESFITNWCQEHDLI